MSPSNARQTPGGRIQQALALAYGQEQRSQQRTWQPPGKYYDLTVVALAIVFGMLALL